MEKPHFASIALSVKNCSKIAVPTQSQKKRRRNTGERVEQKNSGLDYSSPLVLSALARAVPMWGLQIIALSLRVRAWVAARGLGRCFLQDLSSLFE